MSFNSLKIFCIAVSTSFVALSAWAQSPEVFDKAYIPDFSYAGYRFSESR